MLGVVGGVPGNRAPIPIGLVLHLILCGSHDDGRPEFRNLNHDATSWNSVVAVEIKRTRLRMNAKCFWATVFVYTY
ncbi:hypothetical protein Pla52n_18090 [Stieleria varia]|uniref:Uncharacterized protein n=1 Tax=Stieleria varia TaxID=2528005 RepID=A0A5C6B446_9BACT|nr:hypothetical protein Pla52n_18090 [Stieleria varia]